MNCEQQKCEWCEEMAVGRFRHNKRKDYIRYTCKRHSAKTQWLIKVDNGDIDCDLSIQPYGFKKQKSDDR